jgi:predicted RNase H-like HicB family nuclease
MKYLVIYEKLAAGWGAYSPDLPGLEAAGETLDDVKSLIHQTMGLHLGGMRRQDDPIPTSGFAMKYIKVDSHA